MSSILTLEVGVALGSSVDEAVVDACMLAKRLELFAVSLEANGFKYVCLPNFTARRWSDLKLGHWSWERADGFTPSEPSEALKWVYHPPSKGESKA